MRQLTQIATRGGRALPVAASRCGRQFAAHVDLVLAVVGAGLFVVVRPPVADLQAAQARAAAAAHGVGLGYWLSWFGGSAPGDYSVLTPKVTALFGVSATAAVSVVV